MKKIDNLIDNLVDKYEHEVNKKNYRDWLFENPQSDIDSPERYVTYARPQIRQRERSPSPPLVPVVTQRFSPPNQRRSQQVQYSPLHQSVPALRQYAGAAKERPANVISTSVNQRPSAQLPVTRQPSYAHPQRPVQQQPQSPVDLTRSRSQSLSHPPSGQRYPVSPEKLDPRVEMVQPNIRQVAIRPSVVPVDPLPNVRYVEKIVPVTPLPVHLGYSQIEPIEPVEHQPRIQREYDSPTYPEVESIPSRERVPLNRAYSVDAHNIKHIRQAQQQYQPHPQPQSPHEDPRRSHPNQLRSNPSYERFEPQQHHIHSNHHPHSPHQDHRHSPLPQSPHEDPRHSHPNQLRSKPSYERFEPQPQQRQSQQQYQYQHQHQHQHPPQPNSPHQYRHSPLPQSPHEDPRHSHPNLRHPPQQRQPNPYPQQPLQPLDHLDHPHQVYMQYETEDPYNHRPVDPSRDRNTYKLSADSCPCCSDKLFT